MITYVLLPSFQFHALHIIILKGRQATGRIALPSSLPCFALILRQSRGRTYVLQFRRPKKPASTYGVLRMESCWSVWLFIQEMSMAQGVCTVSWRGTGLFLHGFLWSKPCSRIYCSICNFGTNFHTTIEPGLCLLGS